MISDEDSDEDSDIITIEEIITNESHKPKCFLKQSKLTEDVVSADDEKALSQFGILAKLTPIEPDDMNYDYITFRELRSSREIDSDDEYDESHHVSKEIVETIELIDSDPSPVDDADDTYEEVGYLTEVENILVIDECEVDASNLVWEMYEEPYDPIMESENLAKTLVSDIIIDVVEKVVSLGRSPHSFQVLFSLENFEKGLVENENEKVISASSVYEDQTENISSWDEENTDNADEESIENGSSVDKKCTENESFVVYEKSVNASTVEDQQTENVSVKSQKFHFPK